MTVECVVVGVFCYCYSLYWLVAVVLPRLVCVAWLEASVDGRALGTVVCLGRLFTHLWRRRWGQCTPLW